MAKLKLIASPTFKSKVGIPVAGGDPVDVVMTFNHKTKDGLDNFIKDRSGKSDVATFLEVVSGWDLDDEFTPENVETLLQNYAGTALATYRVYVDQLLQAKVKN